MSKGKHVPFVLVPVIGLMAGLVISWGFVVIWFLGSLLAYGLFGFESSLPSARLLALVFSYSFITAVCVGWISWLIDKARQGNQS